MVNYPRCSKYLLTMNILLLLFQRKYMYHLWLFPPLPNKLTPIMHLPNMYRFVSRFPKPCVFRLILNIMSTANADSAQAFKELVLIKMLKYLYTTWGLFTIIYTFNKIRIDWIKQFKRCWRNVHSVHFHRPLMV